MLTLVGALIAVGCIEEKPIDDRGDASTRPNLMDRDDTEPSSDFVPHDAGVDSDTSNVLEPDTMFPLLGTPMLFSPTPTSFSVSAVLSDGDPDDLRIRTRETGAAEWGALAPPTSTADDAARWTIEGLSAGLHYDYQVLADEETGELLYEGDVTTSKPPGTPFSFALITDSHIGANLGYYNQGDPTVLKTVSAQVGAWGPDFMANLGDMLDFHQFGFNEPPPDGSITRDAYLNYRRLLGDTIGHAPHFAVIGNWEGENGNFNNEELGWSLKQRKRYMPGPNPDTYPEGGSTNEDYYAFTFGDALFIVLNVQSYTPSEHLLSTASTGTADDWTLGVRQMMWLRVTLENATSKWRFILIHHAVGGAAGDDVNSAYGRGGGQAAYVGEQAEVHQLMIENGVQIFFYGHDHVFVDMIVDDIHYTMPGNAGAIWMFGAVETGYERAWLEPGWAKVDVTPDSVHVQFIGMDGGVIYEYTL